jgi:lipoteichoic acid synthase
MSDANRNRLVITLCVGTVLFAAAVVARRKHISIRGNLIALSDLSFQKNLIASTSPRIEARLIAHAGGAVRGQIYTNSLDALDEHYNQGYRVFELDFDWTTDGKLVLVHDWEQTSKQFCVPPHVFSYAEFTGSKRCDGLRQMTFADLRVWLQRHRDAIIVTDTKKDDQRLLSEIQASSSDIASQLIIQIYRASELNMARKIRPRAVWFTVYKTSYPAWALRNLKGMDAMVIPVDQYQQYYNPELMSRVRCYVHSIAANKVDRTLRDLPGIYGAYVD